jgi:hypothetical protein
MTLARKHQFDPQAPPWVHAISRCVRRAYLAGGKHEHRKSWVEDRLCMLSGVFAVSVAGYAVMSNHLHVVLRMLPGETLGWSAAEVVTRWWAIYPRHGDQPDGGSGACPGGRCGVGGDPAAASG